MLLLQQFSDTLLLMDPFARREDYAWSAFCVRIALGIVLIVLGGVSQGLPTEFLYGWVVSGWLLPAIVIVFALCFVVDCVLARAVGKAITKQVAEQKARAEEQKAKAKEQKAKQKSEQPPSPSTDTASKVAAPASAPLDDEAGGHGPSTTLGTCPVSGPTSTAPAAVGAETGDQAGPDTSDERTSVPVPELSVPEAEEDGSDKAADTSTGDADNVDALEQTQ
ncbi:hypothetical protein EXIGLDRAFT_692839 [Exidia glandulosa HHB12029]|uniref:Uncharacterized protein n=1 Tax=Exidia glandulosa HHB12029 TaxID=1314781 RepID=A0A166BIA9_EXIGL|nr:hypothetical protein EXIGLDRAFT_692839 [Exidia glandulosa HHB12029]